MFFSKFPTKSRCLRELRKLYDGAELHWSPEGDLAMSCLVKGERFVTIALEAKKPAPAAKQMYLALVKEAFKRYGFATEYRPGFPSGSFSLTPLAGFVGVENSHLIPVDAIPPEEPTLH